MKKEWKALETLKDVDTGASGSDALDIIENALNELEAIKKDVARYFHLKGMNPFLWNSSFNKEFYALEQKLSKVGKE